MSCHSSRGAGNRARALSAARFAPRHAALRLALAGILGTGAGLATLMPAAAFAQEQQQFDIAAGSLGEALSRFAAQAGVSLSTDAGLTRGLRSPGLKGHHSVAEGFARLLRGSGLEAVQQGNGTFTLQRVPEGSATLAPVKVSGLTLKDGSAQSGYVTTAVSQVGPWQGRGLQDTPYSIKPISRDWIENSFMTDTGEIAKVTPAMQFSNPTNNADSQAPTIRGFSLYATTLIDGVNLTVPAKAISFDEVERVEVLSGLSGFLYGAGNVGGTINYVTKRPTRETIRSLRVGNYGGQQYFAHIDMGGKLDEDGIVAYRFNASYQDGETFKEDQNVERGFVSGALDWHINDDLLLQLEAAHRKNTLEKPNASFRFAAGANRPKAFDGDQSYTPRWSALENESDRAGVNVKWNLSESFALRMAWKYKNYDVRKDIVMYPVMQADGLFANPYGFYKNLPRFEESHAGYVYLDAVFNTGPVQHKLTTGVSGDLYNQERYENSTILLPDAARYTLRELNTLPMPVFPEMDRGRKYRSTRKEGINIVVGDDIVFNEQWSALVGANFANLKSTNYRADGGHAPKYDRSAVTPTLSLLFSPHQDLTTYATYIEALEEGVIVGETYANAGEVLDPLKSEQYEIGAKYNVNDRIILGSALFRIEKANQYSDNALPLATYVQDGLQVNQGIEFSITGKLTDDLTVITGGTAMDMSIEKSNNPALKGKKPTEKASVLGKLYLEYDTPWLDGLSLTGGAYYTGKSYGNGQNTDVIPAHTTFDAGMRYDTNIGSNPVKFNLNISNLSDKKYWTNSYYVGNPRTVSFSVKVDI